MSFFSIDSSLKIFEMKISQEASIDERNISENYFAEEDLVNIPVLKVKGN